MFSSPMGHYFRHVLSAYREKGANLRQKLLVLKELNSLESHCLKLQKESPDSPKLPALIGRIRRMKAQL